MKIAILKCFLLFVVIFSINACSSNKSNLINISKNKQVNIDKHKVVLNEEINPLMEIIVAIDYYYIEPIGYNNIINLTIDGILDTTKTKLTKKSFQLIKNNYTLSNNTKEESNNKLIKVIDIVSKSTNYSLKEITSFSLKGLMTRLDDHSTYLDTQKYKEMNNQIKGEFGGLGIVVGTSDGVLKVISPVDGTPAHEAGIKAGDIISKINDKSTENMTLNDAVSLMRGKVNTSIFITIIRKGKDKPIKIKIIRDIIKVQSVYSKIIDNSYLYLRISSFDDKVVSGLKKTIKEAGDDIQGIVLDLRNNPGGLFNYAVETVNLFVDNGVIVTNKGRYSQNIVSHRATSSSTITKLPIAVLVNKGTASGSEIVSGALQKLNRAIIIGEKTYGKGTIQAIIRTKDKKESVKLTYLKSYLSNGETYDSKGIIPDIQSKSTKIINKIEHEPEFILALNYLKSDSRDVSTFLLQQKINNFIEKKDLEGLKRYTEKNPNSIYYISDKRLRLVLTGPKGMKVGDIRKLIQEGNRETLIISLIKRVKNPYKEFTFDEIKILQNMKISDNIISAMIDRTTKLLDDNKLRKQQKSLIEEQRKITEENRKQQKAIIEEQKKIVKQNQEVIQRNNRRQEVDNQRNPIVDKIQDKLIEQGAKLLFDTLF